MHLILHHCDHCRHYVFVDPTVDVDKCPNRFCSKPKAEEEAMVRDGRTQLPIEVGEPASTASQALDRAQAAS